ncbi:D-alanyl-D-alanine carboxypeptidase/D-alanyl-D-alanine-endopeptidase [Ornithinimicrobium sp. LYQ92]|uniref:D-alanyl-D-alanine carboxypeptidase/D-alanyl-D-alanine-endopeptidase n=1 Tax=Serinicoccus sp. LYQ92 TaxID=3378798 RepID=UPI00385460FE
MTRSRRPLTRYALAPLLVSLSLVAAGAPSVAQVPLVPVASATSTAGPDDDAVTSEAPGDAAAETTATDVRPRIATPVVPLGAVAQGPVPERAALTTRIADELGSRWLGDEDRRAITVRDALTGQSLADRGATRLVTPASTTKLLSAAAIVTALDGETTFTTRVVAGAEPGEVVVVAGGDMLLADGQGNPEAVAGRAGIADLAAQTAEALAEGSGPGADDAAATSPAPGAANTPEEPISVSLDLSHVAGPDVLETWTPSWVSEGYTGRIVQLGRSGDRALPFDPSPDEPEQQVARVFREALAEEGVEVVDADDPRAEAAEVQAPEDAVQLATVESAAARDVLALALATSDNAMVEQLARQAAVADGEEPDQESVMAWIVSTMEEDYGLDMTGAEIADASGLSDGTRLSVGMIADTMVAGADGSHPALQEVLAAGGLPIAGYTGTLASRFHLEVHEPAIGNARAKTGSLPGVTSLAGTVVTEDGRLLVYAITADAIEDGGATLEARSVLDEIVAELARCGC